MVEAADENRTLSNAEIFGFACAPVNLGLIEHVQYYLWILNHYVSGQSIFNEAIDESSDNIDYLETSIKCVELYQWLSRHFNQKNFMFEEHQLLENKAKAIERLNALLSDKIGKTCSNCGCKMPANARFNICDECFSKRRFSRRPPRETSGGDSSGGRRDRLSGGRDDRNQGRRNDNRDRPALGRGEGAPAKTSGNSGAGSSSGQGAKRNKRRRSGGARPGGEGKKSDAAQAFRKHR
jgi:ATP-dependent RNA helicase SUPV3L1/SUV3